MCAFLSKVHDAVSGISGLRKGEGEEGIQNPLSLTCLLQLENWCPYILQGWASHQHGGKEAAVAVQAGYKEKGREGQWIYVPVP